MRPPSPDLARGGVFGRRLPTLASLNARILPAAIASGIAAGALLHAGNAGAVGDSVWTATIALALIPLSASVGTALVRRDVGVDAIALLAMVGCLALGELLAGAVVALMLGGGNALELAATRRANRDLTRLASRMPGHAHRRVGDVVEEIAVDTISPGDLVVVRTGDLVPVDGVVAAGSAILDESSLTGEPLPMHVPIDSDVRSGVANVGTTFELRATRPASESAYAAIVRLVESAQGDRSPFVRMADRYAAVLLPLTLVVAGVAWAVSSDAVRALAVLVVATPCPLILAAPIAFVSGVSQAARLGIVVKGTTVLEQLARARSILLDKTGTITSGSPTIERIVALDGLNETALLRLAASLDQLSGHVLAEGLVAEARRRALPLDTPTDVVEQAGEGVAGLVAGHRVTLGSHRFLGAHGVDVDGAVVPRASGRILVAIDGRLAGAVLMGDHPRGDARVAIERLRVLGLREIAMVTGDDRAAAKGIATQVGIDAVLAERTPEGKVEAIRDLRDQGDTAPVVMVGDGVNDAPALALADVGIAIAASTGGTISSQTADVVITVDRLDRVADAIAISRRTMAVARQSVLLGMALSLVAMMVAAVGLLPPVAGAVLQEAIDVGAIASALRAVRPG